jgi:molecular chaperone DnaK
VLLVGGSTRIPKVHDLLEEYFGTSPNSDVNADEGVAHGATVMAGILAASIEDD